MAGKIKSRHGGGTQPDAFKLLCLSRQTALRATLITREDDKAKHGQGGESLQAIQLQFKASHCQLNLSYQVMRTYILGLLTTTAPGSLKCTLTIFDLPGIIASAKCMMS